jgi:hypothetical protein
MKLTFNHKANGPVFVAGCFNHWSTNAEPMKEIRPGTWEATLKLPPGEYQFRYFSNGQWFTDYAAGGIVPNGCGGFNSVLTVPEGEAIGAGVAARAGSASSKTKATKSRL